MLFSTLANAASVRPLGRPEAIHTFRRGIWTTLLAMPQDSRVPQRRDVAAEPEASPPSIKGDKQAEWRLHDGAPVGVLTLGV